MPVHIRFGGDSYREGIDIGEAEFYARVEAEGVIPKTSQPSPGEFAELYRGLAQSYDAVISMHVTGKLSGTYQSAAVAADMVKDVIPVYAFDSGGGSIGMAFMAMEACARLDAGEAVEQVLARLVQMRTDTNIFLSPATLKYAYMSGRVSALSSVMASLLDIKPIIVLRQGELFVSERVRTRRRALERMMQMMQERLHDTPAYIGVAHARAPEDAAALAERAGAAFNCDRVWLAALSTSVAVHLGPGAVGLAGVSK